ncbi:MAG: EAL domain-containing protein, partial [Candidatus Dormibacteria bacterium]
QTGYEVSDLMGRSLLELATPEVQATLTERLRNRIAGDPQPTHYESQLVARDGRIVDVETAVRPLPAEGPTRVLALVRDITARRANEVALAAAALVDPVTRVPNRRAWEEELPLAISRGRRSGQPMCVAIMDIDHFKDYNDDWGHPRGDRLLCDIARAWSGALRDIDFVARYGGDEVAVIMPSCDAAGALGVLSRLEAVTPDQRTTSIGIAQWNENESAEELVGRADAALLEAKSTHRGEVRLAAAGSTDHFTGWSAHILGILAEQRLRAAYQPICSLVDRLPIGYEALARPSDDAGVSVEELFAAAHRLGLTRDMDWLGRKVAVQGAANLPPGSLLFVNASASFLLDPIHDVDQMLLLLKWARRAPGEAVLEISEREVITDLTRLTEVLAAYREHGFRFALDDVGEGHSTLEVMTAANAEYIKLARSMVQRIDHPASNAAIRAVVGFARATGTELIAEGVEDTAMVSSLLDLGITLGQGFGLGRPTFLDAPEVRPAIQGLTG